MLRLPNCEFCVHRLNDDENKCKAYPDGIPLEAIIKSGEGIECANGYSFEDREPYTGEMKTDGLLSKLLDKIGG